MKRNLVHINRFAGAALTLLLGGAARAQQSPPPAPATLPAAHSPVTSSAPATPEPISSAATQVFVYPAKGQSEAQADRDRYECHLWAVGQTGFDPSQPQLAPHQKVAVMVAPPPLPGGGAVTGAVAGAAVGAAVAHPGAKVGGAVVGAVIGGAIGSAADAAHAQHAAPAQEQRHAEDRDAELNARLELQSSNYRRAISACLEGRGYAVQ